MSDSPYAILSTLITSALHALGLPQPEKIVLDRPNSTIAADYTTTIAMTLYPTIEKGRYASPRALAELLAASMVSPVVSVAVAGPGFINFTLNDTYLNAHLEMVEPQQIGRGKKILIEYMQPNTNKPLHIGHLRNAILGKALINLLRATGYDTIAATVNNDRGLHITKSMWAYLAHGMKQKKDGSWQSLLVTWTQSSADWLLPKDMEDIKLHKGDFFVGYWYVVADTFAEDETVQKNWSEMLQAWEDASSPNHEGVRQLWHTMNQWFYEGATQSYKELDVTFDSDHISFESDIYEKGKQIILDNVANGVFEKLPDGAVKASLQEKFNLPDKILLRRDGTGIYMTFDIELTRERAALGADKLVWVVGNDQQLYFQQLFAVCELLGYGTRSKYFHFSYGMVRLPEGKMSSRKGTVVYADDILDMSNRKAREIMETVGVAKEMDDNKKLEMARQIGIGAVKYTILSYDPQSEIAFNVDKSVSFEGNSGPYLQYTAVRAKSILKKTENEDLQNQKEGVELNPEEHALAVKLLYYPETIERAAREYSPHHLATYLFELAQVFNTFYNKHQVIGSQQEFLRLALTNQTAKTLENGLSILGITVPSSM